ncbi:MAG: phosphoglucosamine mutase [Clostridiales bacterium]|nr:phosphoglucosamine mutase [Clostridiales bacterium]
MGKYFGTDGIRGKYGDNLDAALAYKVGLAIVAYFGKGVCVVGRDTRVSGPEIEESLISGLKRGGAEVLQVGVLPTPGIARLAMMNNALCGIVISASHNPPEYNGIKIFDGSGVKLSEEQEGSIEYYIENPTEMRAVGSVRKIPDAAQKYIDYLVDVVDTDMTGAKVWLDCGYGAAGVVAKQAFEKLGASVMMENCSLRGEKINCGCGALHPDYVLHSMVGTDYKLGFAYDGDADRLSFVFDGKVMDGDSVLYNIGRDLTLKDNVVVGTVLTNTALERRLEKDGRRLIRTPVGDKYICDLMFKKGYNLGGEQSGHYIVYPHATTGDGILSSMIITKTLYSGGKLGEFLELNLFPQKAIAEYAEQSIMYEKEMVGLIEEYTSRLSGIGRLIVRMSGTEPKVRVMCECEDARKIDEVLSVFRKYINSRRVNQ